MKKTYNAPIMKVANLDLDEALLTVSNGIGTSTDPATKNSSDDGTGDDNASRLNNLWDQEW